MVTLGATDARILAALQRYGALTQAQFVEAAGLSATRPNDQKAVS